jgi:hypothetical protein
MDDFVNRGHLIIGPIAGALISPLLVNNPWAGLWAAAVILVLFIMADIVLFDGREGR